MNFIEQKNYDINSIDSKNFCIEEQSNEFISKYYILISQYVNFYVENIYENININNDKRYRYYILLKGLEVLSSIMNIIILHTNNIDIAFYYSNKAYYYYIEFISQIDTDNNHLELSIKDAIIFVYKKTIFEIKEPISTINNSNINKENILKLETIKLMINAVNTYYKIFKFRDIINVNINNDKSTYIDSQISIDKSFLKTLSKIDKLYVNEIQFNRVINNLDTILSKILKIFYKFNIINSNNQYNINLFLLLTFIDKLICKIANVESVIDYDNIITIDFIRNLTTIKIKQTISSLDNM